VYTAIAVLLAGAGILWFVRHEAQARANREVAARAARVAARLGHMLKPSDFEGPTAGRRRQALDADFDSELTGGLLRVKLWNREGVVTYSNHAALIGAKATERGELDEALAGATVQGISNLNDEGGPGENVKTIETYVPLRLEGSRAPVGVLEIYQDYGPVARDIRAAVTPIAIALALALLLLYATLLPILRQVTRTLALRNQRLSEHAEALGRALEERQAVEQKLSQAERQYRTLIEQLPLVTYIDNLDDSSSSIYISPQAEDLLGYPTLAWLSDPDFFPKILHPDDKGRVLAQHREAFAAGESFSAEYRLLASDGRVVWVQDHVMIARDEGDRPVHAQGFLLDITERKLAEEAQHETEQKFQTLVANVPGAIFRAYHDEHWTMLFVSDAVEEISGYPASDFIENSVRSFASVIHPEDQAGEAAVAEAIREGRSYTVEYRVIHADGGVRWVLERGQGVGGVDGKPVVEGAIFDITESKLAEGALRESEEKFKALVSNVPGAIYRCAMDADWTMEYLSDVIEAISGYPASDFIRNRIRTYASIIHPDDAARVEEAVGDGAPYSVEYRIVRADGEIRWVFERGQAVRDARGELWLDGAIFDITEQKAAEQALRESEGKFRSFIETTQEWVWAIDEQGRHTYSNPAIERILGYRPEELIGRDGLELIHEEDRDRITWLGNDSGVRTEGWSGLVLRWRHKDGSYRHLESAATPILDNGRFLGFRGTDRDVTERIRAEEERERLLELERAQNQRLRELDKLKDEFIALVSHELRTPLTSIRGYTELLLDGAAGELSDEQRQFLAVVDRNSDRLLHLVGDLLFLAQVEAGKLTLDIGAVDLSAVASESVETARPVAEEKGITLTLATGPVPLLAGDHGRIGQLLDNLVSNAMKFTPAKGRVDVRVRALKGRAILEVRDSGIGIPKGETKFLFQRFFRTSTATQHAIQGTGLGLAICKAIAEAHGGTIAVESEEGAGTTFRVSLPIRQHGEGAAPAEAAL
jgi:PAS domain S-box-containing protein